MRLEFAVATYRELRDRIRAEDPEIDEQTLGDTVEGLTDVNEIIIAIIRSALVDEALANGLRIGLMKWKTVSEGCKTEQPSDADRQRCNDPS